MSINKNEITKEMVAKAMQCKNADELIALAKTGGLELTREEAEAFLWRSWSTLSLMPTR
jgi:hypothetical protein